jgi:erythromycin 3''-O-methyltransferase
MTRLAGPANPAGRTEHWREVEMETTKRPSLMQDVVMAAKVVRLAASRQSGRARRLYELFPASTMVNERTTFINMGYWQNPDDTLDDACEALAEKLADHAGFRAGHQILDVGFGYGDQDFLWLRRHEPAKIVGLNVTPIHVRTAQDKAREQGLADRLDFREGSATAMDLPPNSFDRVVALESAFHFVPRARFFEQAYEVLRPGGVLATADIVPLDARAPRGKDPFASAYPQENWYEAGEYESRLRAAGFTGIRLTSIREKVYEPWLTYMAKKIRDPAYRDRTSRLYYSWLSRGLDDDATRMREGVAGLDYVIVTAEKPQ